MTPKQRHRDGVMQAAGGICFWNGSGYDGYHACAGRLEAHHVIPVQRLRHAHRITAWSGDPDNPLLTVTYDELIADPRNGVALSEVCHRAWESGTRRPLREQLPACVEEFAGEYGLEWSLDRDFGPKPESPSLFGRAA